MSKLIITRNSEWNNRARNYGLYLNNKKIGSDLYRIQSKESLMQEHNKFNKFGLRIKSTINTK